MMDHASAEILSERYKDRDPSTVFGFCRSTEHIEYIFLIAQSLVVQLTMLVK